MKQKYRIMVCLRLSGEGGCSVTKGQHSARPAQRGASRREDPPALDGGQEAFLLLSYTDL